MPDFGRNFINIYGNQAVKNLTAEVNRRLDLCNPETAVGEVFYGLPQEHAQNIEHLTGSVARVRGFGDFWQHMLVAQGAVDIAVDAIGLEPYDIAPLVPIVKAAGGTITDRFGTEDWQANTAVSSNGRLHGRVIEILNK